MENNHHKIKRKRRVVEIEFQPGKSTLKVLKTVGKHMLSMGIPQRGGYELYPEEAVFLHETGSGIIQNVNGQELSIFQALHILESCQVSTQKYETYKTIRLTGLVIIRPRQTTINHERMRRPNWPQPQTSNYQPQNQVQVQFQPFQNFVQNQRSENPLNLELCKNPQFVNFLKLENFKSKFIPRFSSRSNKPCRPKYWPIIPEAQKCTKLGRISTYRLNVDFHVFSPAGYSHNLPARPLFSVICYGSNSPPLNIAQLSQMNNVILAIQETNNINFVSLSGFPINLAEFL
ncbi:unnamed protein product [Caenorhabditis angaria]|uniref:tRNA-splicing endonuclease subunit Sen54 N-terminal domain-containing protein n=1 Tax=Caenorhabditis angaria TaxID=860376 RepID=A0A9P1N303_9PELO|nr:unnamed protein product [Caenorhabditis angaria]